MTLPEFLLARFDDDERRWTNPAFVRLQGPWLSDLVLKMRAECEAKRRILDWAAPERGTERIPTARPGVYDVRPTRYVNEDGEDVLRMLALPYVDHPDYASVSY